MDKTFSGQDGVEIHVVSSFFSLYIVHADSYSIEDMRSITSANTLCLCKCFLPLWVCVVTSQHRCFCITELNIEWQEFNSVPFFTLTSKKWCLVFMVFCV